MYANPDITGLLQLWTDGDRAALDALMPSIIDGLKRIARSYLARELHAQSLETAELVNEAYLRLVKVRPRAWANRGQFFSLTAQIMRRILVDHARARLAEHRGGKAAAISTMDAAELTGPQSLAGLDDALVGLEKLDARKSRIVELRIFGGLRNDEIAELLNMSERTVIRDWQFAKAWISRELNYEVAEVE